MNEGSARRVTNDEAPADLIVVGAGMAGLVAAVRAQELGCRVTLLEKGEVAGGSLALSGGTVWTVATVDDLRRLMPLGDPDLGRVLVRDFPSAVEWLKSLGLTLQPLDLGPHRTAYLLDGGALAFIQTMLTRFVEQGGVLRLDTAAERLAVDAAGRMSGVIARTTAGLRTIPGRAVVLATGGFQANPELTARYFGPWADRMILRSNPHSTGDGFLMGTAVGAAASKAMSSFYGHLLPAPPAVVPPTAFVDYTQYHSEQAILVNVYGERFTDESLGDETSCQATVRQSEALAFLIYDDVVYRQHAIRRVPWRAGTVDTFSAAKAIGTLAAVAPTIEALAEEMQRWGVYAPGVVATVRAYNEAVLAGRAAWLRVPRRAKANPIATPPFYALAVTPGITFTYGGLRIDTNAQVLGRNGRPIPGLYAAGADAGGIYNGQYAGGLALGLVFGRRAAEHAAALVPAAARPAP